MIFVGSQLDGVEIFEPDVKGDSRGFFVEVFHVQHQRIAALTDRDGSSIAGSSIVQINHSRSHKGTLRGLHFQEPHAQGKLVWVARGAVFDVVVDIREHSPTFAKWMGIELSEDDHRQVWIPPGFAHGFCVTSDEADFLYACTDLYSPECEHAIRWDDPAIGIRWPVDEPVVSDKDRSAPLLTDAAVLPAYDPSS